MGTKSWNQEIPVHLQMQGDQGAWRVREDSEEIKTRRRRLNQSGEVWEEQAKEILLDFVFRGEPTKKNDVTCAL